MALRRWPKVKGRLVFGVIVGENLVLVDISTESDIGVFQGILHWFVSYLDNIIARLLGKFSCICILMRLF
jgi:hypothetical protein